MRANVVGERNPAWKGGITDSRPDKRIRVWLPDDDPFHPMCHIKNYVF